jgi:hypothetical protein
MITVLNWLLAHWYVFFWLFAFGVFEGVRDFIFGVARTIGSIGDRRHKRRMKELRAQERIARAGREAGTAVLPKPGPCVHRNVVPVVSKAEEVVAWLCRSCEARLPAEWAVREEDL